MLAKRLHLPDPLAAVTDGVIMEQVARGSRVIDLGCGNGRLLERLRADHDCTVQGVELDFDEFTLGLSRGLPIIRADLNDSLTSIPSGSFDVAVLSQTLQQVRSPLAVLKGMLRIARRALVVVPNFGHWKVRWQVVSGGRAPVTDSLPYEWFESPNVHVLTLIDFRDLAHRGNFKIVKELPIIGERAVNRAWLANLRAHSALYVLERID